MEIRFSYPNFHITLNNIEEIPILDRSFIIESYELKEGNYLIVAHHHFVTLAVIKRVCTYNLVTIEALILGISNHFDNRYLDRIWLLQPSDLPYKLELLEYNHDINQYGIDLLRSLREPNSFDYERY